MRELRLQEENYNRDIPRLCGVLNNKNVECESSMNEKIISIFGNDTLFGKMMNTCGVIIATNLLFIIFSLPVITIGASASAAHFVLLKMRKEDEGVNPFTLFWKGFKDNFAQATTAWGIILIAVILGFIDIKICRQAQGYISMLLYPIMTMGFLLLILGIYLFPIIASFKNKLSILIQNTFYFVCKSIVKAIILGVLYYFCFFVTYLDSGLAPLFAFIWFFFGFGTLFYITDAFLYKEFEPYLSK